ncbi:MAG: MSCRAMM family protein [Candidatus Asgardarchaeia archaeon]
MNKKIFLITSLFLIICLLNASIATHQKSILESPNINNSGNSGYTKISKAQELMSWWNESFEYRIKISITEKAGVNFDLYPINVFLEFEYGHAQKNSIRVLYWDGSEWVGPIISQVWNKTLYSGGVYLKSATVTFLANLTAYSTVDYYIYYSKYDRGSIKFKEMVSGYESSPGSQDYYFEGTYYKVLTNHLKGGKIYQLWHKSTGQEIGNPGSPGDTTYPTHYDPYASQLGHTYGTAINVEGIIEDGPIFIKYHATASFSGSYDDKAEIYYTFYWFGWITEINSSCNDQVDWNYYYPNLWIFDPGSMSGLYYYRESPEAEYQNDNFATGTSNYAYTYGNVTKVAFYSQGSGNAFGYVEVDSKRHNFYDGGRLHYFYYYSSYYQYWYERYNSVTNGENSWKYDKFAMIAWNGRDGLNVFKEMSEEFRKTPEFQISSERVIFKLGVNVINDEGSPIDGAHVFIYDGATLVGTNITMNGYTTLPIDHSGTYTIYVNYTTNYKQGSSDIVVSSTGSISFSYPNDIIATKTKTITLPMGTVTITVVDLLNRNLGSDAYVEIYKNGLSVISGMRTNNNGKLTLDNFPFGSYDIYTSYQPTTRDVEYWISRATYDTITISSSNKDILIQQPIGDLLVSVKAYDNQGMSDLLITLTNQSNVNGFQQHSVLTNGSGIAYFYRIENARWKLQLDTKDSYNQSYSFSMIIYSLNSTLQTSTVNLLIPFTKLNVYVDVGGTAFEGAEVDVRKYTNTELLSSGTTNSSGFITFEYILEGKYNVTVEIYGSKQSKNVYISTNYTAVLSFSFPGITYAPEDSVLLNGNSTNVFFNFYNDNITLKVNYFNRTGVSPDFSDTAIDGAENITIWIYIGNTLIYHITKSDSMGASMIQILGNGTYLIRISTSYLKLNVSSSYYTVKVLIHNTSYSMPTPISYLLKVITVETYSTISKTEIEVSWASDISFQVNYIDDYHNLPIKDANITIAISGVNVQFSYSITLDSSSMLPNGSYVVNLNTASIGLTPGIYTLSVYMSKQNYYDQIKTVSVTIINVPTNLTVFSQPTGYVNWSSTFIIIASYTYDNGTPVLDAQVYAEIQSTSILLTWNGTYYVSDTINSTIFVPGVYLIPLNASKQFHEQKFVMLNLEVRKAHARMFVFVNETKMFSNKKFNVTYSEESNLTITVVYESHVTNITNATVTLIIPSINIQI